MKFETERSEVGSKEENILLARELGLMHTSVLKREGKVLTMRDGSRVTEFANCSYLGLDQDERLVQAAVEAIRNFGIHTCVARSRFMPEIHFELETLLAQIFKNRAITFPSVTVTHMAVVPVLTDLLIEKYGEVLFVFDRFAHASMQSLRPLLKGKGCQTQTLAHNDLASLQMILEANSKKRVVYMCDGYYSMGGKAPLADLKALSESHENLFLYIDDAHGTSIVGENGAGYVVSEFGALNERVLSTFSLSKGFGSNGGGVILNNEELERRIVFYSVPCAFSGPLEYAGTAAAIASAKIHLSPEIEVLQKKLVTNVNLMNRSKFSDTNQAEFSPIIPFHVGEAAVAIDIANRLKSAGFYIPCAFYPVVPKNESLLRVVISAGHTKEQIESMAEVLTKLLSQRRAVA